VACLVITSVFVLGEFPELLSGVLQKQFKFKTRNAFMK
jgi:hypothetical protein